MEMQRIGVGAEQREGLHEADEDELERRDDRFLALRQFLALLHRQWLYKVCFCARVVDV